jgi:iron complex outermembrane receptor protein
MVERVVGFFLLLAVGTVCEAQESKQAQRRVADLTELSLEELMNIEVTSVAKKEQKLSEAAAAIYVITQEDIHRSGATSIAEALRMVPGLQVAQIDAHSWAITSRGFSGRFANKLLVLIDGRSVYTPLFSGVFWNAQDTLLEDIERIEVIRGPAGTLWGANAVNGVINIITKSAKETQGGLVSAGGGTESAFGAVRYGGKIGDNAFFRVFAKYFDRDDFSGSDPRDEWKAGRGGFRVDWKVAEKDSLMFLGDYYNSELGERIPVSSLTPPFTRTLSGHFPMAGGNVLGHWNHSFSDTSDMRIQMYYDRYELKGPVDSETRNTFDFELQHRFALAKRHDLVWGLGYRFTTDQIRNSPTIIFRPSSRGDHLFSAFVQDDITLVENRLRLTLGSKFEHNDYTGFEVQPNVRLLWTPHERHTMWAAVSRAVRTPARFDHTGRGNATTFPPLSPSCPSPFPCELALLGGRNFESEELIAYELGYRSQLTPRFSVDIATFYHVYDHLLTGQPGSPFLELSPPPPHVVLPIRADNLMHGEGYGVEIAGTWNVTDRWRLGLGYTLLRLQLHLERPTVGTQGEGNEKNSPKNQFHLRSYLDLPYNLKFDAALYYVDSLPNKKVSSYVRGDARLGWNPTKSLDVSIALQNLFDRRHREIEPEFLANPTSVERSVYGKITWRF